MFYCMFFFLPQFIAVYSLSGYKKKTTTTKYRAVRFLLSEFLPVHYNCGLELLTGKSETNYCATAFSPRGLSVKMATNSREVFTLYISGWFLAVQVMMTLSFIINVLTSFFLVLGKFNRCLPSTEFYSQFVTSVALFISSKYFIYAFASLRTYLLVLGI